MNSRVFVPSPFVCAIVTIVAPASARSLDLPVRDPRNLTTASRVAAPAYAGDVLELRLASRAARLATARLGTTASAEPSAPVGVPSLDALAADTPGLWFEPMFRNEKVPENGSAAPDLTAFYVVHLPPDWHSEHSITFRDGHGGRECHTDRNRARDGGAERLALSDFVLV
jgi:hypothetical protein